MIEKKRLRSMLFVPAYNEKFINKAINSDADAIILDVEDSVPNTMKNTARKIIAEYSKKGAFSGKQVFIRVNKIGTEDFVSDISTLIVKDINGIVLSKIDNEKDIIFVDKLLSFFEIKNQLPVGEILLAPLIETSKAMGCLREIATASNRMTALCFGGEDYLNDIGCTYAYYEEALKMPRTMIVNAARAYGLLPIDTPYIDYNNLEGFKNVAVKAYKQGFAGSLLLNPKQIEIANCSFTPSKIEVDNARHIIESLEADNSEKNILVIDGAMVGPPMIKRAKNILDSI